MNNMATTTTPGNGGGRERPNFNSGGGHDRRCRGPVPDRPVSHPGGVPGGFDRNVDGGRRDWDDGGNDGDGERRRAGKRRKRHDLPGPAGAWLRRKKKRGGARKAAGAEAGEQAGEQAGEAGGQAAKPPGVPSDAVVAADDERGHSQMSHAAGRRSQLLQSTAARTTSQPAAPSAAAPKPSDNASPSPDEAGSSGPIKTERPDDGPRKESQLFHDHSADLHECPPWNLACVALGRVVPPVPPRRRRGATRRGAAAYRRLLRSRVPGEYALVSEVGEGRHDGCCLSDLSRVRGSDLRLPPLVGYVASVQCDAHSDWTALLVDETHGLVRGKGGNGRGGGGRGDGITCWIEEGLVRRHPGWVRPGVVWMIEGARIALFNAACNDDDDDGDDEEEELETSQYACEQSAGALGGALGAAVDVSPSTDAARGGNRINRMILVSEASLVYAWTPEEATAALASEHFKKELLDLTEQRLNLAFPGEERAVEIIDEGGGAGDDSAYGPSPGKKPEEAQIASTDVSASGAAAVNNKAKNGNVAGGSTDDIDATKKNTSGSELPEVVSRPGAKKSGVVSADIPDSPAMFVRLSPGGSGTVLPNDQIHKHYAGSGEESALEVDSNKTNLTREPLAQRQISENVQCNQQSAIARPNPYANQKNSKLSTSKNGGSNHSSALRPNPYVNRDMASASNKQTCQRAALTPQKKQLSEGEVAAKPLGSSNGAPTAADHSNAPLVNASQYSDETRKSTAQRMATSQLQFTTNQGNRSTAPTVSLSSKSKSSVETKSKTLGSELERENVHGGGVYQIKNNSTIEDATKCGQEAQVLIGTGDSFDDMLDEEDEDNLYAGNSTTNSAGQNSMTKDLGDRDSSFRPDTSNTQPISTGNTNTLPPAGTETNAFTNTTSKGRSSRSAEPQISTGDSFDDMLDEDEEDIVCGSNSLANNEAQNSIMNVNAGNREPSWPDVSAAPATSAANANTIPPPSAGTNTFINTTAPVEPQRSSIFDSLDDSDMDLLDEDD